MDESKVIAPRAIRLSPPPSAVPNDSAWGSDSRSNSVASHASDGSVPSPEEVHNQPQKPFLTRSITWTHHWANNVHHPVPTQQNIPGFMTDFAEASEELQEIIRSASAPPHCFLAVISEKVCPASPPCRVHNPLPANRPFSSCGNNHNSSWLPTANIPALASSTENRERLEDVNLVY